MSKLKDKFYDWAVRKNKKVKYEYENYVMEHIEEHKKKRFKHWKILLKLNWHYRVKKKDTPLLKKEVQKEVKEKTGNTVISNIGNDYTGNTIPAKATNVSAIVVDNAVCLKWKSDARICNIYRSTDGNEYKFCAKTYDACIYMDDKIGPSSKYYYKLKLSYNGENYSSFSDVASVTTKALSKYDMIYGRKLLCRGGSESECNRRADAIVLAKSLIKYDLISFDIFDTLIFRPFKKPSDVFMLVGQQLDIMDYCNIRMDAEEEARKKNLLLRGNREVTIDEIYEIVSQKTGIDKELGIKTEFETEMELCYANPYMHRVFEILKHQSKKIVIVSDMYYSKDKMIKLLNHIGYTGFDEVIVSCDYNCTKRDGKLFDVLLEKYKDIGNNIIHIGDNKISDIQKSEEKGLSTYHYVSINERGEKYRATNMSHLIGSAYEGVVNSHLHNGIKTYSPYYEVGFVYAGLYVMGFCNWLYKKVKEKNITKLLFLAREGDIYQRVFNQLFDDIETEYVLWSRVPVAKTTVRKNRHPYLLQLVHHKAHAIYKSKVATLFERIGISELKKYFAKYRINNEEFLTESNEKIIEQLLIEHWEEVCECYKEDEQQIQEYLESIVGNHSHVAVVDVGWSGNNVLQVRYLIEEVYQKDCKVECYLAATRNVNDTYMASMMLSEKVDTYIFSNMQNKDLHDFHQETNNRLNSFFFEILTQSCTPTFLGFEKDGFLYDIPEVENFEHNREIHKGILDFVKIYTNRFEKYSYMLNISGYDAYMPFRLFVSDLNWLREYFSGYVFGRDLFATQEKAVMETVKEVMDKAKV